MTVSFDRQAAGFDRRTGLPAAVARQVAAAVATLAPAGRGALLELGAGTGQIGEHLARLWGGGGSRRYLAIDLSAAMLAVFRRRLAAGAEAAAEAGAAAALVRADAGAVWPLVGGSVDLVFLSRAAHLLPGEVLVEETLRVASPRGAFLVVGGVRSEPDSLRAVLRRQMRRLLAEHGGGARDSGEARRRIADALAARGGEVLPVQTAASWPAVHRAGDALADWRSKPGLGGRAVSAELQESVLQRLEEWVRESYGGIDVERQATEHYDLAAVRLPRLSESNDGGT